MIDRLAPRIVRCASQSRVVAESAIVSKPSQSPRNLYSESSLSKSFAFQTCLGSLTLPQTAVHCCRSVSDLCESHAMDSIDQLRSLLTQSLRSIGIRSGWSQSHACIPFDSESWASQCLTVSLAVGGASQPSPRPSTKPHQPPREHALTQP